MADTPKPSISFFYKKTPNYRVHHVSGIIGGLTPHKKLYLDFFVEKPLLPEVDVHELTSRGELGALLSERPEIPPIERMIDVGIMLDLDTARAMKEWLGENISKAEGTTTQKPAIRN